MADLSIQQPDDRLGFAPVVERIVDDDVKAAAVKRAFELLRVRPVGAQAFDVWWQLVPRHAPVQDSDAVAGWQQRIHQAVTEVAGPANDQDIHPGFSSFLSRQSYSSL